jgi:hypothetical protein
MDPVSKKLDLWTWDHYLRVKGLLRTINYFHSEDTHLLGLALILLDQAENSSSITICSLIFSSLWDINVRSSAKAQLDVVLELNDGLKVKTQLILVLNEVYQ